VLFLGLYYAAVAVLVAVADVSSHGVATAMTNAVTPVAAFNYSSSLLPASALAGIVIQLLAIAFLISAIRGRVQQTELVPAAAAGD
jgi:ABC-type transport system involved in cytochrome c biogenesis permease subunit